MELKRRRKNEALMDVHVCAKNGRKRNQFRGSTNRLEFDKGKKLRVNNRTLHMK